MPKPIETMDQLTRARVINKIRLRRGFWTKAKFDEQSKILDDIEANINRKI